jgi:hypothetical protein
VCSPSIEQLALAHLISTGEYERHIRRARTTYHRRRDALRAALHRYLPDLPVEGIAAGLHLLVRLSDGVDDECVAVLAEQRGVREAPLSRYTHASDARSGLVIGYGRIHETAIPTAVRTLGMALQAANVRSKGPDRATIPGRSPGRRKQGDANHPRWAYGLTLAIRPDPYRFVSRQVLIVRDGRDG